MREESDSGFAFARFASLGADVVQEPTVQPYGLRDFAVRDPAGNLIRVNEQS